MKDSDKTKVELIKELETLREEQEKSVVNNITESKQTKGELKDSEEWLKILFDHAPDAYYVNDLKGSFVDGNKQAERFIGYKKEELIGKNFLKLKILSTKDMPKAVKSLAKNILGLPTGPDEYVLNRKDKSSLIVEISNHPVNIKGKTYILGIARDITKRKQTEKILKESEERYHSLFENTGTATMVFEDDMIISLVNSQAEKLCGYSKEEIENKMKWTDFVVPEDLERMKKYHLARREAGEKPPTEYEFRLVDRKGKIKDIFLKIDMISHTKKSIASLVDITELKKTQEGLQKSREEYFNLFNNANDLIQVVNSTREFLAVNKKWLETLEYTQEEVKDLRVTDIIRKDKIKQTSERMQEIVKGKSIGFETVFISKSGKEIIVEGRGNGLFKDGKFVSAMGIFRDITKRKQSEEQIKHLNLVLCAIRNVDKLIAQEKECKRLIQGVCNNLVETRGFYNAWIMLLDEKGKLKTYAEAGLGENFLSLVELLKKGKLTICSRKALKQQEMVIIEDPASSCTDCPLAQKYASRSAMTIRLEHEGRIFGLLSVSIPSRFIHDKEEQELLKEVAGDIAMGLNSIEMKENLENKTHDLQQSYQRTKKAMDATITTMSRIIEAKDPYTAGHQQRVSQLAVAIAKDLNLSQDKIEGIRIASLIHDIGKIGIPTEILSKPTKLSDLEFSLVKAHPQIGYDILKSVDFSYPVANIVLQHHERLNGSGYPQGIKSEDILLDAKIIGVADVVEAMSSHRPYRPALGVDKALEEISQNKGIIYDPEVVDTCLKLFKEKGFKFE